MNSHQTLVRSTVLLAALCIASIALAQTAPGAPPPWPWARTGGPEQAGQPAGLSTDWQPALDESLPDKYLFSIGAQAPVGQFNEPCGLAIAGDGSVYVSDVGNQRIQVFSPTGQFVRAWGALGNGEGQFAGPCGVAVTLAGEIVVADTYNSRIQVFTPAGEFLRTWGAWGDIPGRFYDPSGVAVGLDGTIYVVEGGNDRVQQFTPDGQFVRTWGSQGSGPGQFLDPFGVAVGPDGSVYVTEKGNHRVQRFSAAGQFLGMWGSQGSGAGQFEEPFSVAVAANGTVHVTDHLNHRIQSFSAAGQFLSQWGAYGDQNGQLDGPLGVAVAPDGSVYVSELWNSRVQRFTANGDFLTTWGEWGVTDGKFEGLAGVARAGDGTLYVAGHDIQVFSQEGLYLGHWGGWGSGDGEFQETGGVAVAPTGTVYVADRGNHRVQYFTADGQFLGQWGSEGQGDGQFTQPYGIAVASNGNVYVADMYNHRIQRFSASGQFLGKWGSQGAGDGQFNEPRGVAVAPNGTVYVVDKSNQRVQYFSPTGQFLGKWGTFGDDQDQFNEPSGIAIAPDETVYVANAGNHQVQRFSAAGQFLGAWGNLVNDDTEAWWPIGLATAPDGRVYVADETSQRVLSYAPDYASAWRGEYFANPWLAERPLLIQPASAIDFAWGNGSPDPSLPADNFSGRWQHFAWLLRGDYRFTVVANGGVRLWLDQDLLVDRWVEQSTTDQVDVSLSDDSFYRVRLEYFDGAGPAELYLSWAPISEVTTTPTASSTATRTASATPTSTRTATATPTRTPTASQTASPSPTPTGATPATATPTRTATPTATATTAPASGDAFEEDDACGQASQIAVTGAAQTHTFHDAGDQDWMRFAAAANKTYIIETSNVGPQSDAVLFLFDSCSDPPLAGEDNAFGQTVRLTWNSTASATLYIKLQQHDPAIFGAATNYDLAVAEDRQPPSAPRSLRAAAADRALVVQWRRSPEEDVTRYRIRWGTRSGGPYSGVDEVDGVDNTYYEITGLANNTTYYLVITAVDFSGNESPFSVEIGQAPAPAADATQPTLAVTQPGSAAAYTTTLATLAVAGDAQDSGSNLSRVLVRNADLNLERWDYSLAGGSDTFQVSDLSLRIGDNRLQVTVYDDAGNSSSRNLAVRRLSQSLGAVIIVAGHNETFSLQSNIHYAANRAYRMFRDAGFTDDNIYYLAHTSLDPNGDGVSEVDALVSPANVQQAILTWASQGGRTGPGKPLHLYLMDHGELEYFCADGCNSSGRITASQLNQWLDTLEAATGLDTVNVILEMCRSGSFIDRVGNVADSLAKAGRVVISSTDRNNNAYASAQGAYFSDSFFSCLAASNNFKACFEQARTAVALTGNAQAPWLDDNGDGLFNNLDGAIAQSRQVARFFGATPPRLLAVSAEVQAGSGALQAQVEAGSDPIDLVWAAVYAPSFQEPADVTLELGVPTVRLLPVPGSETLFRASYPGGFAEPGMYRIVFYAQDHSGDQAQPRLLFSGGRQLFLPVLIVH